MRTFFLLGGSLFHHFLFVFLFSFISLESSPKHSSVLNPALPTRPDVYVSFNEMLVSQSLLVSQILPMLDHLLCLCLSEFLKHDGICLIICHARIFFCFSFHLTAVIFMIDSERSTLSLPCCVLVQPFWPMGTGCARGFLAAFDTAWMVRSWAQGQTVLEVLAERSER